MGPQEIVYVWWATAALKVRLKPKMAYWDAMVRRVRAVACDFVGQVPFPRVSTVYLGVCRVYVCVCHVYIGVCHVCVCVSNAKDGCVARLCRAGPLGLHTLDFVSVTCMYVSRTCTHCVGQDLWCCAPSVMCLYQRACTCL